MQACKAHNMWNTNISDINHHYEKVDILYSKRWVSMWTGCADQG